jgi:hypothetical protein
MGFFQALTRFLGGGATRELDEPQRARLLQAWNLYEETPQAVPNRPEATVPFAGTVDYDRAQWHRRLKTLLERLPDSEDQWPELMADVKALGFDPAWVNQAMRDEFVLLVRRAVADRTVTPAEHRKLDIARLLIGISEDEAEQILKNVVSEAESFFGETVERAD